MCGISGYIGRRPIAQETIARTLGLMKNRGPDCQRSVSFSVNDTHVTLLHSRLGIIDLDERSNQPFTLEGCTIVFNGEIYNYIELRQTLKAQGISFTTDSDTEVLLRYYLRYGESCVSSFEGMWSFAIYDARHGTLFLSRDRFAEKPLYYLHTRDGLYFGSETRFVRSLVGEALSVNIPYLLGYLVNGYKWLCKTDNTYFEGVKRIPYATSMVVDGSLEPRFERYWHPAYAPVKMSLSEAVQGSRHHLLESMRIRLRSDVPVAFCLSGGIDSSALASIAAKVFDCPVTAFSIIDEDERYNEYNNIKSTVDDLHCEQRLIRLAPKNSLERLAQLIGYHDAPIATITYFIHSFLTEEISALGFRVAFSGTGADELFTGYYDHFNLHLYEMREREDYAIFRKDWELYTAKTVRNPFLKDPELYFRNPHFRSHIYMDAADCSIFLQEPFESSFSEFAFTDHLLRNRTMNELFHEAIPTILNEEDLNSMMYSIENRSPYLDSRLFGFMQTVPSEYLIRQGYGKFLLREAVKGILNDKVRLDRQKKGFNASIFSVFDFRDPGLKSWLLSDSPVYRLVKIEKIQEIVSSDEMCDRFSRFLFNFINAKIFLETQES